MPTIAVRDLAIQRRDDDLVAATFGRGFFVLDDYSPLREVSEDMLEQEAHLFPVKDAWWYHQRRTLGELAVGDGVPGVLDGRSIGDGTGGVEEQGAGSHGEGYVNLRAP